MAPQRVRDHRREISGEEVRHFSRGEQRHAFEEQATDLLRPAHAEFQPDRGAGVAAVDAAGRQAQRRLDRAQEV